jgi:replication factor A1
VQTGSIATLQVKKIYHISRVSAALKLISHLNPTKTMPVNLTPNAIAMINGGDVNLKPLVQVLDIKQMGSAQERFRLLVSDSVLTQHAMLGTQLNDRVKTGLVKKGSVIQLIDYICSQVQKRKSVCFPKLNLLISSKL